MFSITNLMAFIIASAAVIFVPGPATFYVVGKANIAAHRAVWSVAGIVLGDVVLISVAGFGFAAIVTRFPIVLELMKYVGAAYIIYLGVGLLRAQPAETTSLNTQGDRREDLLRGFLLTVTNPKPILFFVAFFPLFIVDETLPYTISFYALGGMFQLVNLTYFACIICAVAMLSRFPLVRRFMDGGFNKMAGVILIGMALLIVGGPYLNSLFTATILA